MNKFISVIGTLTAPQQVIDNYLKNIINNKDKVFFPQNSNSFYIKSFCNKNNINYTEITKNMIDPVLEHTLTIIRLKLFSKCYFLISDAANLQADYYFKVAFENDPDKIEYKVF